MSLFAVKNDKGEWLYSDEYNDWVGLPSLASFYDTFEDADVDIECWQLSNAYVVELVEAPAKVVVSEDEDKVLKKAKDTTVWRPAAVISKYAYNAVKDSDQEALLEDRLMRAYVIGWVVEKPKQFVLPMEGTKLADGTIAYATLDHTGVWTIKAYSKKQSAVIFHDTVTKADIDAAPDWVKSITPIEVKEND